MTFVCKNMIDEETFKKEFDCNPYKLWKYMISDGESVINFADEPVEPDDIGFSYT